MGPRYDLFLLSGIRMSKLLKILKAAGGLTSFPPVEKKGAITYRPFISSEPRGKVHVEAR